MNPKQKLNRQQGENGCNSSPNETERPTDNKVKFFYKNNGCTRTWKQT